MSGPKKGDPKRGKPVPPDAVRVWRGYRIAALEPAAFLADLGSVFIPVTAQLQRLFGLTAYLPTVLPVSKPDSLPDEIALVFYETQKAYNDTKLRVAGRAYSLLHSAVFQLPDRSQSGFPTKFAGKVEADTPHYLFDDRADWQTGYAHVFVGARKAADTSAQFLKSLAPVMASIQKHRPAGLEGAVVCGSADWVLYWELWADERSSLKGKISDLAGLSAQVLLKPFESVAVETSLTADSEGFKVKGGSCLNVRFPLA